MFITENIWKYVQKSDERDKRDGQGEKFPIDHTEFEWMLFKKYWEKSYTLNAF